MSHLQRRAAALVAVCGVGLAACGSEIGAPDSVNETGSAAEPIEVVAEFPADLRVVGDGYPRSGEPCRQLGESEATSEWLDDSARLVGCPTRSAAEVLGGRVIGTIQGITVVSVPLGDANAGLSAPALERELE